MSKLIRKTYEAVAKAASEDRTLIVTISTVNPDRSNDVVMPKGADISNYLKNPVVAFGHNYSGLAVGKTVDLEISDDRIVAKVEFVPKGVYPLADQLYEMYKGGFMNAWSIGFIPKKWSERGKDWRDGREFQEWELLEYSAVLVPDNAEALTMLRSKGVNVEELEEIQKNAPEEVKEDAQAGDKPKEGEGSGDEQPKEGVEEVKAIENIEIDSKENTIQVKTEDGKVIQFKGTESLMAYLKELHEAYFEKKEGRVLSEKNRKLISESISTLKASVEALEALLVATEPKGAAESDETKKVIQLTEALKVADKVIGLALRDVKDGLNGQLHKNAKSPVLPIVIGRKEGEK